MAKQEILEEKPISLVELKSLMNNIKKRDGELTFRASKVENYLNQLPLLSQKKEKELRKKIEELNIPRMKEEFIIKIVDLLPKTLEDMKVILQEFNYMTVSQENLKKILNVVKEYTE